MMAIKLKLEEVLIRFNKAHNGKYDYSLITKDNFKNTITKVPIICSIHGLYYQDPFSHMKGRDCDSCVRRNAANNKIEKIKNKFNDRGNFIFDKKYDYSLVDYKNNYTKVKIICPIHGEFFKTPAKHLNSKEGCPKCSALEVIIKNTSNNDDFIKKSLIKHGNIYNYSNVNYKRAIIKVDIICSIHGIFKQTPNDHLNGYGCRECGYLKNSQLGLEYLISNPEIAKLKSKLYFLEFSNINELFYKVGTTTREIYQRFSGNCYNIKNVDVIELPLIEAKKKEIEFINNFKEYKYSPLIKFPGHTECFKKEIYNIMFK